MIARTQKRSNSNRFPSSFEWVLHASVKLSKSHNARRLGRSSHRIGQTSAPSHMADNEIISLVVNDPLILSAVALLGWRIFGTPRRTLKLSGLFRRKTPRARKNPRLAKLASLPFPQAADSSFDEDDLEKSEGTLVSDSLDPYHVVSKTFDASLIARANSFEPTPVPEPIFKREEFDEKAPIAAPVVFSPKLSDSSPWVFPRETKGRFSSTTSTDLTQLNLLFIYCRRNISSGIIATRQPAAASKNSLAYIYIYSPPP
ncbi:uncharacterized protein LACBIDRAFT_323840 [Laccaria bicolor S238N-H82]|uniref:Predicted protein n=1 Tax=Laccaria bicolor (strain S238N-H82 / ATCC MYA-4686) TaxID=486041 RepID=B0CYZ1_LACBS|nr:uncharacterized protein LACBIDRAFT_323840 [Laccaria bicolor S238N-H82]EDR12969.1 predicted protein [Laccaria bicolor S238N-H82]|eukprot:XP_001877233.1 predicted protein [Laccaria bicolor S238N-H82]